MKVKLDEFCVLDGILPHGILSKRRFRNLVPRILSFQGTEKRRHWERSWGFPYFLSVRSFLENIGSQPQLTKKKLLTGAFDFTALFADKVVSISEAAQRAERFARLAGCVVVKWLVSTLNHARWDSVPNWIPDLFANVVGLERNWKKKDW